MFGSLGTAMDPTSEATIQPVSGVSNIRA
jgi:hypothetical protein